MNTSSNTSASAGNATYSISLQDKPRGYKINVDRYYVSQTVARRFHIQFIQLWWKKVKFKTIDGNEVEGYLSRVEGDFSNC